MDNPKLRRLLILLHLYGAAFMAPAFFLLAFTGAMYLLDIGEAETSEPVNLPANVQIDFKSPTATEDVRTLLEAAGVDVKFEYIRDRGNFAQTRPTSRPYVAFEKTETGWKATKQTPNLQKAMMEIHKGHGPRILRTYHILVGITLFFVVFGGIIVGLLAKAYRRKTVIATLVGFIIYLGLVLFG